MIDKRIGERIKQSREKLGLTQDQFAEKIGLTTNYISTIERGAAFPRYDKLIRIINGLETSADAIFCDVIVHSTKYRTTRLSEDLDQLSPKDKQRILETLEFLINQTILDKGIMPSEKVLDFPVDCNTLTGSVNL